MCGKFCRRPRGEDFIPQFSAFYLFLTVSFWGLLLEALRCVHVLRMLRSFAGPGASVCNRDHGASPESAHQPKHSLE